MRWATFIWLSATFAVCAVSFLSSHLHLSSSKTELENGLHGLSNLGSSTDSALSAYVSHVLHDTRAGHAVEVALGWADMPISSEEEDGDDEDFVVEEAEDISEFDELEGVVGDDEGPGDDDDDGVVLVVEDEEEEEAEEEEAALEASEEVELEAEVVGEDAAGEAEGDGEGEEGLRIESGAKRRGRRKHRAGGEARRVRDPRERKFHPGRMSSLYQRSQDRSRGRGRRRGRGGRRAYVERCPGSCILTKLRRQSARVHSGNFSRFDGVVSRDDDSSCKGSCGSHGFCRDGRGVCVALYEGERCERSVSLPKGLHPDFGDRDFVINSNTLRSMVGKVITYKTNPKAGDGLTHTLKLMVSDQMVGLVPERDVLGDKLFESCAIVGSSGVLLSTARGEEIDAHSAVIRFNKAPTKGFETYVGSKTTLRLVNTNHALMMHENETIIQQMQSRTGWLIYRKILKQTGRESNHYAFHPDFSTYVSSNTRALPTNGYFALFLALHRCVRVKMYGFFHSATFKFPYHYFNREVPRKGGSAIHDYAAELEDILRLANHGTIEMSELCMAECAGKATNTNSKERPCKKCPLGSYCDCEIGMPLPVAKPGFCHVKQKRSCFVECPGGLAQCPEFELKTKKSGQCPDEVQEMVERHEIGLGHCD